MTETETTKNREDHPHSGKISLIKIVLREDLRPEHSRLVTGWFGADNSNTEWLEVVC